MVRIENWSIISKTPYASPEADVKYLQGKVYGHPRFEDGYEITTSRLIKTDLENNLAETLSRIYELGQVDPEYAKFLEKRNK